MPHWHRSYEVSVSKFVEYIKYIIEPGSTRATHCSCHWPTWRLSMEGHWQCTQFHPNNKNIPPSNVACVVTRWAVRHECVWTPNQNWSLGQSSGARKSDIILAYFNSLNVQKSPDDVWRCWWARAHILPTFYSHGSLHNKMSEVTRKTRKHPQKKANNSLKIKSISIVSWKFFDLKVFISTFFQLLLE